jgi:prepilin-type processing-associated H-X9-DG protein
LRLPSIIIIHPLTRHQRKANVVFCDGHVESPALKFLFEDTSDTALARWNQPRSPATLLDGSEDGAPGRVTWCQRSGKKGPGMVEMVPFEG